MRAKARMGCKNEKDGDLRGRKTYMTDSADAGKVQIS